MPTKSRLCEELKLNTPIAVICADEAPADAQEFVPDRGFNNCSLTALTKAMSGKAIYFKADTPGCKGFRFGMGFVDEISVPGGGFEYFLSCGKGEGFPPGERIKKSPEVARNFQAALPNKVHASRYVIFKPLEPNDASIAKLVIFLGNPDQISALIHLYSFESGAYDETIAPMCSGCASIVRIPLDELRKEKPRASIGLVDIFARPNFPADCFALTVSIKKYLEMEENSGNCFIQAPIWGGVKKRLPPI